jgi:hypothetical protein
MLKRLLLALLLANGLFLAYTQGWLAFAGLVPQEPRESHRLAEQVEPGKLRILNAQGQAPVTAAAPEAGASDVPEPQEAAANGSPPPDVAATPAASAPAPEPTACWQVSGFSVAQTITVNAAMQKLGGVAKGWSLNESVLPARWIVYLGKFANSEALQRRRAELRQERIEHREVNVPALQPGLALGTYSSEEAARKALQQAQRDGVRDARVVQERQESRTFTLRLPAVTDSERRQIEGLGFLGDKTLQPCS